MNDTLIYAFDYSVLLIGVVASLALANLIASVVA